MGQIPLGDETTGLENSTSVDCSDVTAIARLTLHVKNNNIAYLIGTLVFWQIGAMDKALEYASGLC